MKTSLKFKSKIISFSILNQKLKKYTNKKIGFTNGCFDILHTGHLNLFKFCKKNCDILIVAINTDISIKKLKGKHRPHNTLKIRLINLSKIKEVDYIIYFHSLNPIKIIKKIKPLLLFKGSDYKVDDVIGSKFINSYGGKTILAPYIENYSTTNIIKRIN